MKTVNTLFGDVTLTDVRMVRKQGYGQYQHLFDEVYAAVILIEDTAF